MNGRFGWMLGGLLTAGGMAGCGSSEGAAGGGGTEATTTTANDASTVTTSSSSTSEASSSTGVAPTTVRVIDEDGLPVEGVLAFANDAEGEVVDEATSDDAGQLTLDMPDGGSVHVAREELHFYDGEPFRARDLISHFHVSEGADITVKTHNAVEQTTPIAHEPMKVTAYALMTNSMIAPRTEIGFDCRPGTTTTAERVTLDDYVGCPGKDTFSIYAMGYDEDGLLIAAGKMADVPFVAGDQTDRTITMQEVLHPTANVTFDGWAEGQSSLSIALVGRTDDFTWTMNPFDGNVSHFAFTNRAPKGMFDSWLWFVSDSRMAPYRSFQRYVYSPTDTLPSLSHVDVHDLASVHIAAFDRTDRQHPRFKLTLDDGPMGDFVYGSLIWHAEGRGTSWIGYAPPAREVTLQVPALPESIADWTIQPDEEMTPLWSQHVDSEVVTSPLDATKASWGASNRTVTIESAQ